MEHKADSASHADGTPLRPRSASSAHAIKMDVDSKGEGGAKAYSRLQCIQAAALYSATGIGTTLVNKTTLTMYQFPSPAFIALAQFISTVVVIAILKALKKLDFEDVSMASIRRIMPLPLFFLGNAVCSLGGGKSVSIPQFSALRKFSVLFTMMLEAFLLKKPQSRGCVLSVMVMILGTFIAAFKDLDFDAWGYAYVLGNDIFTAGYFVVTKQKADCTAFGATGSLFYCALLSTPLCVLMAAPSFSDVYHYHLWGDHGFLVSFVMSALMGCLVTFATMWCTSVNSGLTTCVLGCLRNIVPVYAGMLRVFAYTFHPINFLGHTVSVMGAISYTALKLFGSSVGDHSPSLAPPALSGPLLDKRAAVSHHT